MFPFRFPVVTDCYRVFSIKGFEVNTEPTAVVVKDTKENINDLKTQSETKRSTAVYITMASPEAGDYIKLCAVVHKVSRINTWHRINFLTHASLFADADIFSCRMSLARMSPRLSLL